MINGLSSARDGWFAPIAFVDLDGVVLVEGTPQYRPGAVDRLRILSRTHRIVLFSSRGDMDVVLRCLRALIGEENVLGAIQKPLACSYAFFDDRLNVAHCGTDLPSEPLTIENTGPWRIQS